MQLYILIATTDVPHIIEVYPEQAAYSKVKSAVRAWARERNLIAESDSVRTLKESEPGVWLEQTSFGWLLKRIQAPVQGWLYNSASSSSILAEIRMIPVEQCSAGTSFAEQRQLLLSTELELSQRLRSIEQELADSRSACAEQQQQCEKLRNEIERDQHEQMLCLMLELEKCKQGSQLDTERLNKLNISLADVLYTAQALMWTLNQTEQRLNSATQQLTMSEAIYELELQQERCTSAELQQRLEQAEAKLREHTEFVLPELAYKHELEMVNAQTALSNLQTEYSLAKESWNSQLSECMQKQTELERVQEELASHNLEQSFEICLLRSTQTNLRQQLQQREQQRADALDQLSLAKDQLAYERQNKEREQSLNEKLDGMCSELAAEVERLRSTLATSEAESTDAWVCRGLMAENERLQQYAADLAAQHQRECNDIRSFITEQEQEHSEQVSSLERRLQSQAQTIKNFQEEKAHLQSLQQQLAEENGQLKWREQLRQDQSNSAEEHDQELAVLRSRLEQAQQREREMEENLEQTLRMSEERRTLLNSQEKESDIYFEQWQNCVQSLQERSLELDRLATAQQETSSKLLEKQKRVVELESIVRKMESDLAYVVDLHWGRSLQ